MIESISFNTLKPARPAAFAAEERLDDAGPEPLRLGATGDAVKALQQQLNALGEQLPANGHFGPRTMEAVRRFQLEQGISPANGAVTAATERALSAPERRTSWGLTFREPVALTAPAAPGAASGGDSSGSPPTPERQRAPDWFSESAQRDAPQPQEAAASSLLLVLSDGRSLTVEQALRVLDEVNARAYSQAADKRASGAEGRAQLVGEVNQLRDTLMEKGFLTAVERAMVARSVRGAFAALAEVFERPLTVREIVAAPAPEAPTPGGVAASNAAPRPAPAAKPSTANERVTAEVAAAGTGPAKAGASGAAPAAKAPGSKRPAPAPPAAARAKPKR